MMENSFDVPDGNPQYVGDETQTLAEVFHEQIQSRIGASREEAVATFNSINVLVPRGRHNIAFHLTFFRVQGKTYDVKVQYSSVATLFLLPKFNQPYTIIVVTLDPPFRPPICKGLTTYRHMVLQFKTDCVVETTLSMSEDLLNNKFKDRLQPSYEGPVHEIFTSILSGLSGAKVTRPGNFRSDQDEFSVESRVKTAAGSLFPLEQCFFFLPRPSILILYKEIVYVELQRSDYGGSRMDEFDLFVKLKDGQEHVFGKICSKEYDNLADFIRKKLKVRNFYGNEITVGIAANLQNEDADAADLVERLRNSNADESDGDDEDFIAEEDDGDSPTDDSGGEDFDDSDNGGEKENFREANPELAVTEVCRALGERSRSMTMTAEEKEPFKSKAQVDQKRYKAAKFKSAPMIVDSGNDSDSE